MEILLRVVIMLFVNLNKIKYLVWVEPDSIINKLIRMFA